MAQLEAGEALGSSKHVTVLKTEEALQARGQADMRGLECRSPPFPLSPKQRCARAPCSPVCVG
eukprot:14071606-Alexandrium_andersonii.AAC.1